MSKSHKNKTAFLILAAGESKRMGRIKQVLPWQGKTLLAHLLEKAKQSEADDIFVVLGANSNHIQSKVNFEDIKVIFNPNWKNGIGSSLSLGIKFIERISDAYSCVLISLADQPLISLNHFNNLITDFRNSKKTIAASKYKGILGVPAVFDHKYFGDLSNLRENIGAKNLISNNPDDVIAVTSTVEFLDIDTPDDYTHFIEKYKRD